MRVFMSANAVFSLALGTAIAAGAEPASVPDARQSGGEPDGIVQVANLVAMAWLIPAESGAQPFSELAPPTGPTISGRCD